MNIKFDTNEIILTKCLDFTLYVDEVPYSYTIIRGQYIEVIKNNNEYLEGRVLYLDSNMIKIRQSFRDANDLDVVLLNDIKEIIIDDDLYNFYEKKSKDFYEYQSTH